MSPYTYRKTKKDNKNKSCDHRETTIKHVNGKILYICVKCGEVAKEQDLFAEQEIPGGRILHS